MPNKCQIKVYPIQRFVDEQTVKYYIDFKLNGKRFRLFNGKYIGSSSNPNSYPPRFT